MSISPQEELEQKVFLVRDDQAAEWCMKKIREAEAEYNRMEEWYDMQIQKARERCESTVNYMTTLLMKYQLPSGELVLSKAKDDYKAADNQKLLDWCAVNDPDLLKTVQSPKWADIKKRLTTVDGKVVDKETGLFVDGVEIEHKEAKFEVKAGGN